MERCSCPLCVFDMTPTPKQPEIVASMDEMSKLLGGGARGSGTCATCSSTRVRAHHFRDEISAKEFKISGMCQSCQDSAFSSEDE